MKALIMQNWPVVKLLIVFVIGVIAWLVLGGDSPIEQEAEKVIKEETGLTVDISP